MAAEHLLALDAGTSALRCLIARPGQGVVAVAREEWCYETTPDNPLGRSFEPEAVWATFCKLIKLALVKAGIAGRDIAAIGTTSQRLALIIVDADGRSLYAGPNIDVRAVVEGLTIDATRAERVYASAGKLPSMLLAPARLHWLANHDDAGYQRAAALLAMGDWMAYRLTGELRSERSLAGDCGLLDVSTGERDSALLDELGVRAKLLPPLVSAGEVAGQVTKVAAEATGLAPGTPVVIAGADTQCADFAMGVREPGDVGIVAGWSCPLQEVTAEPCIDAQRRTWTSLHVLPERWVVESSTADAGRTWRWWCETLLGERESALEDGATLAGRAPAGAGNVLALLGPAAMNAGAWGIHLGGLLMTTPLTVSPVGRPELLRAALENIAFALRANLEQAQEVAGLAATRVVVGGGLTRSPVFPSILASVLERAIDVASEPEASALGAAALAARTVGVADDSLVSPVERVEPDAGAVETYRHQYERWRHLCEALDRTMKELS